MQRVLALHDLLHDVRHHMAHGQLHVAAEHLVLAQGPTLTDAHTVERTHDGVRQAILLVGGNGEILHGQLLESVRGQRRRHLALVTLHAGPMVSGLEHHGTRQVGDLLQPPGATGVRLQGSVTRGGNDALVAGQQIICVRMKIADAADECGARDEVVTIRCQLRHQRHVGAVPDDELIVGTVVVALGDLAVLGVVVDPHHLVAAFEQFFHHVSTNEPGRTGNEHLRHVSCPFVAGWNRLVPGEV